ncbi:MAG: hypothetical protein GX625_16340 [Clostridiaceae bacterium]|nr:hypothetical protein [Clostridiaceae bacterium]
MKRIVVLSEIYIGTIVTQAENNNALRRLKNATAEPRKKWKGIKSRTKKAKQAEGITFTAT